MNPYKNFLALMNEAKKQQTDIVADSEDFQILTSFGLMNSTFAIVNLDNAESILKSSKSISDSRNTFITQVVRDLDRSKSKFTRDIKDSSDFYHDVFFWGLLIFIGVGFISLSLIPNPDPESIMLCCYVRITGLIVLLYPCFVMLITLIDKFHKLIDSKYLFLLQNIEAWRWKSLARDNRTSLYSFVNSTDPDYCMKCKTALQYAIRKRAIQNVRFVESALISSDILGDIEIVTPEEDKPVEGLKIAEPTTVRY